MMMLNALTSGFTSPINANLGTFGNKHRRKKNNKPLESAFKGSLLLPIKPDKTARNHRREDQEVNRIIARQPEIDRDVLPLELAFPDRKQTRFLQENVPVGGGGNLDRPPVIEGVFLKPPGSRINRAA